MLICVRRGHTAQHTPAPTARGGKSEQTKMHFYSFLGPYINSCGSTHTRSDGEGRPRSAAVTRLATTTPPMANTPRCDSEKSPPPHRARRKCRRRRSAVSRLTRKIEDVTQRNRRRRRSAASRLTRRNRRCDSAKSPSQPPLAGSASLPPASDMGLDARHGDARDAACGSGGRRTLGRAGCTRRSRPRTPPFRGGGRRIRASLGMPASHMAQSGYERMQIRI